MNLPENPFDLCKLIHETNNIVINLEIFLGDAQDTEQRKEKQSSNKPVVKPMTLRVTKFSNRPFNYDSTDKINFLSY